MEQPTKIPKAVQKAIHKWAKAHPSKVAFGKTGVSREVPLLPKLAWDSLNGCYYFTANGIYYGVELDGYIHT